MKKILFLLLFSFLVSCGKRDHESSDNEQGVMSQDKADSKVDITVNNVPDDILELINETLDSIGVNDVVSMDGIESPMGLEVVIETEKATLDVSCTNITEDWSIAGVSSGSDEELIFYYYPGDSLDGDYDLYDYKTGQIIK